MGIDVVYKCDNCGIEKQKTNRWFQITRANAAIRIEALDYRDVSVDNRIILCGEACVHTYIAQSLATLHPPIQ